MDIEPRANGRPICSGCGKKRPGYDRLAARRFEFVPLWNMAVFFVYAMRRHRPLILNWFLALGAISAGTVEGFNGKAKLSTRKAYGFRTPQGIEFALLHVMGNLLEPQFTHRFC